jgi:hypothetical protein
MDEPSKERSSGQWLLAGAGLLLGVAAAYLAFHTRPPATAPLPPSRSTATTALYVQHDGGALRLHWDPGVRANSGVIRIRDGARESRLDLNAGELRSGVASYWPESKEVTFQMELDGAVVGAIRAPAAPPSPASRPAPVAEKPRPKRIAAKPVKLTPRERDDPDDEVDSAPKRSRWNRVTGKIPLLKRLHKH